MNCNEYIVDNFLSIDCPTVYLKSEKRAVIHGLTDVSSVFKMSDQATLLSRRFSKDETGVSAVEFALLGPLLALIFIGVVNLGLVLAAKINLEKTVYTASNYIMTSGLNMSDQILEDIVESKNIDSSVVESYKITEKTFYDRDKNEIQNCDEISDCKNQVMFMEIVVSADIKSLLFEKFIIKSIDASSYIRLAQ